MKIVHVTGYFVADMAYQENLLPIGHAELGHDVVLITGCNDPNFGYNAKFRKHEAGVTIHKSIRIHRLPQYFEFSKNRGPVLKGLLLSLFRHQPDLLFIHDIGFSLIVATIYKLINRKVILQFDCHSTFANAGRSRLGFLYHGLFRVYFHIFSGIFDRLYAVAPEVTLFMMRNYGLRNDHIQLLPLPGDSSGAIHADFYRTKVREQLAIRSDETVIVHTGKLPGDKETEALLSAFRKITNPCIRLAIAGTISPSFQNTFEYYLKQDSRILFIGWCKADYLRKLFYAADLLVQPGSLSNTFIDAVCCGIPILLDDTPQGQYLTSFGNGITIKRSLLPFLDAYITQCIEPSRLRELKAGAVKAISAHHYTEIAKITLSHLSHV
jgi:hypothetical protein